MSGMAMSRGQSGRPQSLQAAVAITIFSTLIGNVIVFFGGPEGASAFGLIIGVVSAGLHLLGAWGLWNLRRWGLIMTAILTVLDGIASIPLATGEASDNAQATWFTVAAIIFLLIDVVILVLLALPTTRRVLRRA